MKISSPISKSCYPQMKTIFRILSVIFQVNCLLEVLKRCFTEFNQPKNFQKIFMNLVHFLFLQDFFLHLYFVHPSVVQVVNIPGKDISFYILLNCLRQTLIRMWYRPAVIATEIWQSLISCWFWMENLTFDTRRPFWSWQICR